MIEADRCVRIRPWTAAIGVIWAVGAFVPPPAEAQDSRVASIEFVTGHAGYVDEVWDNRAMAGGVVRFRVTPRVAVGPEVVYLHGANGSHEMTLTAEATYDLAGSGSGRRVVPFLVVGAGLSRRSALVGGGPGTPGLFPYATSEATVSAGIGARIVVGRRVFVAADARLGWEPERRVTVAVGWRR